MNIKNTKKFLTFLPKIIVKFIYYFIFLIGFIVIMAELTNGAWQSLVLPFLVTPLLFTIDVMREQK